MRRLALIALLLCPALSQAAPWCLRIDADPEVCNFNTADACYRAALYNGGSCYPNAREIGVKGDGVYCMVTPTMRKCTYRTMRSCRNALQGMEEIAGCVENYEKALEYAERPRDDFKDLLRGDPGS